jgi:putative membrane protein
MDFMRLHSVRHTARAALLACGLLATGACKSEQPPTQAASTTGASTTTTSFSVGDTFHALATLHTKEIEINTLAERTTTDPRVKAFAQKVVQDHQMRIQKDAQLAGRMGVKPTDNEVSQRIRAIADDEMSRMSSLSGSAFDRTYIDGEIGYYRSVLDAFDHQLLPNTRDPQVRADLMDARSRANEHLKEAQDLRGMLTPAQ